MEITTKDLNKLFEANTNIVLENKDTDKSQDYDSIEKRVIKESKLNFKFVFTFGTAITALYPIIESFIKNDGTLIEYDLKETVVYLTICALAIAFKESKGSYKKIFEELRLRGAYKFLKPVVAFLNVLKNIFMVFAKKTGVVVNGLIDMFTYTALFVPFAIIFQDLIALNNLTLDGIISAVTSHGVAKLISSGVSIGAIYAKHFFSDLFNRLKKFNPLNFENIKKAIGKLKKFTLEQIFGIKKKDPKKPIGDIKKFSDFDSDEEIITEDELSENKYVELDEEWGSLGEYVEKFQKAVEGDEDDELEFLRILGKHLDSKSDIRVANAVDLLNEYDQRLLVKELEDTFFITESTTAEDFVQDIKDNTLAGKGGFNSFLKVITALNLPEIKPDIDNCPKKFSIIYSLESINKERLLGALSRFRSLSNGVRIINNLEDNVIGIYFGLKFESNRFYIEYGILGDGKRYIIGEFKFGSPQYRKMMKNKSKVLQSFQDEMGEVDLKDLKLLMKIKNDFTNFSPGYFHRKSNSIIKDNVLIQGFYGVGNWNNGVLNKDSYESLKEEFKNWVLSHRWKENVLINIKPGKFWVYFKIKMID